MGKFTKRELAELTGYTMIYLDKILREMKEMGMVRKIGAGTKIWWKLRRKYDNGGNSGKGLAQVRGGG